MQWVNIFSICDTFRDTQSFLVLWWINFYFSLLAIICCLYLTFSCCNLPRMKIPCQVAVSQNNFFKYSLRFVCVVMVIKIFWLIHLGVIHSLFLPILSVVRPSITWCGKKSACLLKTFHGSNETFFIAFRVAAFEPLKRFTEKIISWSWTGFNTFNNIWFWIQHFEQHFNPNPAFPITF